MTPISYTRQTLGCETWRARRTSLRKRVSAASVKCALGKEFQRDGLIEDLVVSAVDLAHTALTEESEDAVAVGENRAGGKAAFIDRGAGRRGSSPARHRDGRRL